MDAKSKLAQLADAEAAAWEAYRDLAEAHGEANAYDAKAAWQRRQDDLHAHERAMATAPVGAGVAA